MPKSELEIRQAITDLELVMKSDVVRTSITQQTILQSTINALKWSLGEDNRLDTVLDFARNILIMEEVI